MISVVIGLSIGMTFGIYRIIHDLFMPTVYIIQLIPGLAWIPITLLPQFLHTNFLGKPKIRGF